MLVVLLCCMMKIVEFSTGKPVGKPPVKRRRRYVKRKGKTMNEVGSLGVRGLSLSPDSDCNSNHHGSTSYLSNTSSQDIDFIQDNSDYQWFLDYGYREASTNHHTSILSLPESYEANDMNYYDALAKNMDANLAEADMESFRTEDIHALLTNLPPMCTDHLSQENNREGENYASVSGSMMAKFDFDSSISPHSSSHGEDSAMSIYKSELLFSPVKETPMPGANFSVDSLDCDMMLTCQANKDNYTIAFEGSVIYSDSDYHDSDKSDNSAHWMDKKQAPISKIVDAPMTQSDSGSFTTWSKLKKRTSDNQLRRHPSGNNNNSGDSTQLGLNENSPKSQSMPNLYKQKLRTLLANNLAKNGVSNETAKRKAVKVFDIQHHSSSGSVSDMATSVDASSSDNTKQANFSLVKLFMKQKSMSTEGMSTTMDQLSSAENWPNSQSSESNTSEPKELKSSVEQKTYEFIAEEPEDEISRSESVEQLSESISSSGFNTNNNNNSCLSEKRLQERKANELMSRSIQTSQFSEIANLRNKTVCAKQVKVVEPSFLNKLKKEGEVQKPVYVLYPSYVLPNLDFLNDKQEDLAKVLLIPQDPPSVRTVHKRRPFSCNDVEMLKQKGFGHVEDWDSLNFLLPLEYRKILAEVPELSEHFKSQKPSARHKKRLSCDYSLKSSSSSTGTQPSSGYRGSSTILTDSQNSPNLNPLFVYRYDSVTSSEASLLTSERQRSITTAPPLPVRCVSLQQGLPPRPPLPKGILRKGDKRFSLYETSEEDLTEDVLYKRKPYFLRAKRFSETEDEGVDAGTSSSSVDEHYESLRTTSPNQIDGLLQLEEFLKMSGLSSSDGEDVTELRSCVSKFLSLKINQDADFGGKKSVSFAERINMKGAPNNSPNVSAFIHKAYGQGKTLAEMPICEESEASAQTTPVHKANADLGEKRALVADVSDAVELLVSHFSSAGNQSELNALGDSVLNPALAKLALNTLCPALYAVLSNGLKPNLETSFGAINNSVWQVVEASAQQGPLTKALNELVMRINSEDAITEGLVKFNAFVFGLLNVRSLDAWISYLKTRESILKKHYTKESLLLMSHAGMNVRNLLDTLIGALQPLALLPFQFDLLFEYRQLHLSFKRMEQQLSPSHPFKWSGESDVTVRHADPDSSPTMPDLLNSTFKTKRGGRERPRSCVDAGMLPKPNFKLGDVAATAKKRWSGISANSKLYLVYDRLAKEDDEEYTDSLENTTKDETGAPESLDSNVSDDKPLNGRRFKKLQQKWEMLSGRESSQSPPTSPKSKIPRPITSPVKPSGIPVLVSPTSKRGSPTSGVKPKSVSVKGPAVKKQTTTATRTSRLDQVECGNEPTRHIPRPSSLPYKVATPNGKTAKVTPPRRAASSSLNRKPLNKPSVPKVVRTLCHKVPSESGHLSYNEGERLKVVLEVDDKWLLCCRGSQKGLVPKSAVIADSNGRF